MSNTRDPSEVPLEFIFASPLSGIEEKEFFGFLDKIASIPDTQVWIETFKELHVGKVPENLFLKHIAKEVEEKGGWLKISKPITTQHLYPDTYAYLVTIVTLNIPAVSAKLHEYCYEGLGAKGGKVILRRSGKETLLVPYERQLSQEELTNMIC